MESIDLTADERAVLLADMWESEPQNPEVLATELGWTAERTLGVLQSLKAKGLVELEPHA